MASFINKHPIKKFCFFTIAFWKTKQIVAPHSVNLFKCLMTKVLTNPFVDSLLYFLFHILLNKKSVQISSKVLDELFNEPNSVRVHLLPKSAGVSPHRRLSQCRTSIVSTSVASTLRKSSAFFKSLFCLLDAVDLFWNHEIAVLESV